MIEFEGGMLLSADPPSAQPLNLLASDTALAVWSACTIPDSGIGENLYLQNEAQEAGDAWISALSSRATSEASAPSSPSLSETVLIDRESNEEEGEDIIITGKLPSSGRTYTSDSNGSGATGGSGGTGGSTGGSPAQPVEQHTQDCGTDDGAAVQVAKHVKGELPTGVSGPVDPVTTASGNDWTKVEFGAMIVKNPDGSFGALNDMIYSNDRSNYIQIQYNTPQAIQGFWHSHPAGSGEIDNLRARYPSSSDWSTLANIAGGAGAVPNPSLWIMDFKGITREFKLDERAYFESLDDSQKVNGEGLAGKDRAQACA